MFGKGALILVIGFAIIAGYLNLNISQLTSRAVEGMVGYNQLNASRSAANAGANIGLAILSEHKHAVGVITSQSPKSAGWAGTSFVVTLDSIPTTEVTTAAGGGVSYTTTTLLRLTCCSSCTTGLQYKDGSPVILQDTVEVRLASAVSNTISFSTLGWMTVQEGNVFFITGDTLFGRVHSNSNIHISGSPVFMERVTTSGKFDPKQSTRSKPTTNKAIFMKDYETGVAERPFPNDLSLLKEHRTNSDTAHVLYVQLKPGTSADNDGYAIVRQGSWTGAIVDSMSLSGGSNNVIYSHDTVHVKGSLDGRLSVVSNTNLFIDGDIKYEREPDPSKGAHDPANEGTSDMLGLIAEKDVIIADNDENSATRTYDSHGRVISETPNDLYLDGSIFCRTGSFTAQNYQGRGVEGRIFSIGSIAQQTRGIIGQFSGDEISSGFLKSYKYDARLSDPLQYPPFFPGFSTTNIANAITNWWESGGDTRSFWQIEK
jgi:hypothetical protein